VLWIASPVLPVSGVALGFGYAYSAGNGLRVHDLATGAVLLEIPTNGYGPLRIVGERLHALRSRPLGVALDVYRLADQGREPIFEGSVDLQGNTSPLQIVQPLFAGDRYAYVGLFEGYRVVDLLVPAAPAVVGLFDRVQPAIHSLFADGGGLLAAVTSFAGETTLAPSVYSTSAPTVTTNLLTRFDTPGNARKLVLHCGRMFIADDAAGLTVANYRAFDRGTNPPIVQVDALTTSRAPRLQESRAVFRAIGQATDDVVVREVEFYIDGQRAATVGSYPFETDLIAPAATRLARAHRATGRRSIPSSRASDPCGEAHADVCPRAARDAPA